MHRIRCAEIWGGIQAADQDLCTNALAASLYSSAAQGRQGGDIYYFSVCGADNLTRIVVADVVGHGETVSRISQWLYDALATRMDSLEGSHILAELNQRVTAKWGLKAMTTAAVASFYLADTHLYFSYAGHPPLLLWRQENQLWQPVKLKPRAEPANLPLGVLDNIPYDQEQTLLTSGDRLLLYTDGLIEAPDPDGHPFGEEKLQAILAQAGHENLPQLKQAVLTAVRQHTGGSLAHDDITLVAIEIK